MTTIYLLRHAQSRPDQAIAEPDWPLSELGVTQARALVAPLGLLGITSVYSSPYPRAIATVQPFADSVGLNVNVVSDLRERKLREGSDGDYRALLRQTWHDFSFAAPGGESSAAAQKRVMNAVQSLAATHPGEVVLAASHGNAIALYLNSFDRSFGYDGWATMKNPDIYRITVDEETASWERDWKLP